MYFKSRDGKRNPLSAVSRFCALSLFLASLSFCGCEKECPATAAAPENAGEAAGGGPVMMEKRRVKKSRPVTVDGRKVEASVVFDMEYPSPFGISADEYCGLTAFIDGMLGGGKGFDVAVEGMSEELFRQIELEAAETERDEEQGFACIVKGRMTYSDSRYVSYELSLSGSVTDTELCTFDRKKGRSLITSDIVSSNDYPVLRRHMSAYIRMAIPFLDEKKLSSMPRDWPFVKDSFCVNESGVRWDYFGDGLQLGVNMEIVVGWKELKDILIDSEAMPSGKFGKPVEGTGDDSEWWRFPYEKFICNANTPPDPPFAGRNHPYADLSCEMEIPGRGNMPQDKFDALQSCLGAVVSGGEKPHATVKEAVTTRTKTFWKNLIKECGDKPEDGFGILALGSEIKYRGPEYVSCSFTEQDGPPSGTVSTNIVWSWKAMRPLRIEEVVDMRKRPLLAKMMRDLVREDLGDEETVLPGYAKDWPHDLSNFRIEADGIVFSCHAGDILAGGHGPYETVLAWERMLPVLRKDFVLPGR